MDPAFRELAAHLRAEIVKGRLAPGHRLPSEHQLAGQFHITRSTVRKAIALLKAEGHVVTRQGKGAFVRTRPLMLLMNSSAAHLQRRSTGEANFSAEVRAQGGQPEQRILSVAEERAPVEVAERLDVAQETIVLVRRRLLLADGLPLQLADSYHPVHLAEGGAVAALAAVSGGIHRELERRRDPGGPLRRGPRAPDAYPRRACGAGAAARRAGRTRPAHRLLDEAAAPPGGAGVDL